MVDVYEGISSVLSPEHLQELACSCGFMKRRSKLDPSSFIDTLVFTSLEHHQLSLQDCCNDLAQQSGTAISKVAMHKRFNEQSVSFLRLVLAELIGSRLDMTDLMPACPFVRILLSDSTKFSLPLRYADKYPGYGGCRGAGSLMNIQYGLDIKNGEWERLELTKATHNDQTYSNESLRDIQKGDLLMRDLGYVTKKYLSGVVRAGAFFLNRLPPKWTVCHPGSAVRLDWGKLHQHLQGNKRIHSQKASISLDGQAMEVRLVALAVPKAVWEARIRKAAKHARSKGVGVSDEYKVRCRFNVFITNATENQLDAQAIINLYRIRWQVELMFKVWKSLLAVHEVKTAKMERMESMLLAKFIWIVINCKVFCSLNTEVSEQSPQNACSVWKFFKCARNIYQSLRGKLTNGISSFKQWCMDFIIPIVKNLRIEPKKNRKAAYELLGDIYIRMWTKDKP